jgi:hypothetical protein
MEEQEDIILTPCLVSQFGRKTLREVGIRIGISHYLQDTEYNFRNARDVPKNQYTIRNQPRIWSCDSIETMVVCVNVVMHFASSGPESRNQNEVSIHN